MLTPFCYGGCGIRTHAPLPANGFQDRLVMTASITLRAVTLSHNGGKKSSPNINIFARAPNSIAPCRLKLRGAPCIIYAISLCAR